MLSFVVFYVLLGSKEWTKKGEKNEWCLYLSELNFLLLIQPGLKLEIWVFLYMYLIYYHLGTSLVLDWVNQDINILIQRKGLTAIGIQ